MELTKREKELLILYKAFYGRDFDCLDLPSIQGMQNMYCILQTVPSSVWNNVKVTIKTLNEKSEVINQKTEILNIKLDNLKDFELDVDGVFSENLDTELTKLSQACEEVKKFNKSISVDYFIPITVACTNPDIDLSSDQGIVSKKDYVLFAKACLFASGTRKTKEVLEEFLEQEMKPKTEAEYFINTIKGKRNIHLAYYIVQLLRGYGVIDDYHYIEKKEKFKEDLPTLSDEEKEFLRNYCLFYDQYYDPSANNHVDNGLNAYSILQNFPDEVGVTINNNYEFLKSTTLDRVESSDLKKILTELDKKKDDIIAYYNKATVNQVPISRILLESGFTTVDALGRIAGTCLFIEEHPDITGKEVYDYLNSLDRDDGYLNNVDDNLNKKIVNILERYGIIKRYTGKKIKCDSCEYHEEIKKEQVGVVKKLARILGGQKEKN